MFLAFSFYKNKNDTKCGLKKMRVGMLYLCLFNKLACL